jgi:hypothetical protein
MLMSMVPVFNVNAGAAFEYTRANTGNLRDDLVAVAQSQVGYIEESYNHTKFGRDYGVNGEAWCALFVWWCCDRANVPGLPTTMSCSVLRQGLINHGAVWHSVNSGYAPRKGDLVFFTTTLTTGIGHAGIVREDSPAEGPIHTIEGNTMNPYGDTLDGVFAKDRPLHGSVVSVYGYLSLTDVSATYATPASLVEEEEPEEEEETETTEEEYEEPEEAEPEEAEQETESEETEQETEPESKKHGWQLEDGSWHYYDFDGELLVNDWAPTSYGWRWMDGNGDLDESVWADEYCNILYV